MTRFAHTDGWSRGLYTFACLLVTGRLFTRLLQSFNDFKFEYFLNPTVIQSFFLSFSTYLILVFIAHCLSKCLSICRTPVIFVGLLLFLYFISLFNIFTFNVDQTCLLWMAIFVISLLVAVALTQQKKWKAIFPDFFDRTDLLPRIIIVLISFHALTYCLEANLDPNRSPYGDEGTLWVSAAEVMIYRDTLAAHLSGYPGGGLHPFGISFIAALPTLLVDGHVTNGIYFFALIVIIGLTFFLTYIRHQRWVFLFFVVSLFSVFHDRGWLARLAYQLVYGEGFSVFCFLMVSFTLFQMHQAEKITKQEGLLFALIVGLLALSKSPLAIVFPLFLILFFGLYYTHQKKEGKGSGMWLLLMGLVSFMPYTLWMTFKAVNKLPSATTSFEVSELLSRLGNPHMFMLNGVYETLGSTGETFCYFAILSFIFVIVSRNKDLVPHMLPIVFFFIFVWFYYAYVYAYGSKTGDAGSSLRYILPVALALFYYGGVALDGIMASIQSSRWKLPIKITIQLILVALVVTKLF